MSQGSCEADRGEQPVRSRRHQRRSSARELPDSALIARVLALGPAAGVQFSLQCLERGAGPLSAETPSLGTRATAPHLTRPELDRLTSLVELVRRLRPPKTSPAQILCAEDVLAWADSRLVHLEHEELWLLCLDGKHALICAERVAQGGLHGCGVTPRDVLRPAVRNGAAAVVVVHNHPSGDPTPSQEDIAMTQQLAQACAVLGMPLLDHVVVARAGARSAVAALR